jgi:hypothetical protein
MRKKEHKKISIEMRLDFIFVLNVTHITPQAKN